MSILAMNGLILLGLVGLAAIGTWLSPPCSSGMPRVPLPDEPPEPK